MTTTFNDKSNISYNTTGMLELADRIRMPEENFYKIRDDIKNALYAIQSEYNNINNISSPIITNEYLWGLIKCSDYDKSLNYLLGIIQKLARSTTNAFQANGKNLEAILELIKVTITVEEDLYTQLDNCEYSKENLSHLLNDICAKFNIDNEAIDGLLEKSFHRTITLKTRLDNLRAEIFEHIYKYEYKFDHLDEIIQNKEDEFASQFDSKAAEYKSQLDILINDCLTDVNNYKNELIRARNLYNEEFESIKKDLMESINLYNEKVSAKHDVKFEKYDKENTALKNQVDTLNGKVSKLQSYLAWSLGFSSIATLIAVLSFFI